MSLLTIALIIGLITLAALALFLAYAATRPAAFEYSRSVLIAAPAEAIFPHINRLQSFDEWNPFAGDPKMQLSYSGPADGPGAASAWTGGGSAGTLTITDTAPPGRIDMRLAMKKPIACDNYVIFTLAPEPEGTRVTWTMGGQNGFAGKVMSTVFDGEKMCAGMFEKGLADLKTLVEAERRPALHVA